MQSGDREFTDRPTAIVRTLIVSEVRFSCDCLAEVLARYSDIQVCGQCASLAEALETARTLRPAIVLLDVAFPGSFGTVAKFAAVAPEAAVVALAIVETEENVLAWAEAGVAGYVPNTASVDELVALLGQIIRGEQTCSSRVSGSLLRRVALSARARPTSNSPAGPLTRRESEIFQMLAEGQSNKEIARRLSISLGTTKSHVHNLLQKLSLRRRIEASRLYASHPAGLISLSTGGSILSRSVDR